MRILNRSQIMNEHVTSTNHDMQ